MKSPIELKQTLRRHWDSAAKREARLLGGAAAWPIVLSIGRPKPRSIANDLDAVRRHVEAWRNVKVGEVVWEPITYRATAEPVDIPVQWKLRQPTEWLAACADPVMRDEFGWMGSIVERTDKVFHSLLIRRRSLWRTKPIEEVLQAAQLATMLEPHCAEGKPLRTLSIAGIDTKFFERNVRLITDLLDTRFDGEPGRMGLETFLGALSEGDRWLLVMDLDGSLLPFKRQRVPTSELVNDLPGERVLIVENETCQHQLPALPQTIAILGSGFDVAWTESDWLQGKQVGYWGDIDTWGLHFLAAVRQRVEHVEALLMTDAIYDRFETAAVPEPINAGSRIPTDLTDDERLLYSRLTTAANGRLEQEFLEESVIHESVLRWASR